MSVTHLPRHACTPIVPSFGHHFLFQRVLHTDTAAANLRALLNQEWSTISVVAGLFVLLSGGVVTGAPVASELGPGSVSAAVFYVNLFAGMSAYIGSATSCLVSLFLLHTSNTVPEHKLHAFLLRTHSILWLPLGGLFAAVLFTSIGNNAATFIIYNSWGASATRISIAVVWLGLLAYAMYVMSEAAKHSAGPRRAQVEERAALEESAAREMVDAEIN